MILTRLKTVTHYGRKKAKLSKKVIPTIPKRRKLLNAKRAIL